MKKTLILLIILISLKAIGQTQGPPPKYYELPTVIMPPPDVASFGKYGNTPVGHYTGIPNISIPFYQIKTKSGLTVPVSISYHAGGVKVDEKASRVGLGWSLSCGGGITQEVNGIPDRTGLPHGSSNFIPNVENFMPIFQMGQLNADYTYAENITRIGRYAYSGADPIENPGNFEPDLNRTYVANVNYSDSEPDIFHYSIPGSGGKFIIDKNKNFQTIPYTPIKITRDWNTGVYTIIDTNGNQFIFSTIENKFLSGTSCNSTWHTNPFIDESFNFKLTKIITNQDEEINFTYTPIIYDYTTARLESDVHAFPSQFGCNQSGHSICENRMRFQEQIISKIEYNNTVVEFTYSNDSNYPIQGSNIRKDFTDNPALRKIQISYDNNGTLIPIKSFELKYDYFNSVHDLSTDTTDNFRLKLTEIIENANKKHLFEYDETYPLPGRFSNGQDFWGYFNGQVSQATGLSAFVHFGNRIPGANKNINPIYNQSGILKKITYPTKGSTSFDYEANSYYSETEEHFVDKVYTFPTTTNQVGPETHTFTVTEANKYGLKVNLINDCPNTGTGFNTEMCIVKIFKDGQGRGTFTTTGVYEIPYTASEAENGLTLGDWTMEYTQIGNCNCTVGLSWVEKETLPPGDFLAGGLRIKNIIDDDGEGNLYTTLYDYIDPVTGKLSSILHDEIRFTRTSMNSRDEKLEYIKNYVLCKSEYISNSNMSALGKAGGAAVGYAKVSEIKSGANNYGKTLYEFTNFKDEERFTDRGTHGFNLAETKPGNVHSFPMKSTSLAWKRGLPLKTSIYDKNNNLLRIEEKTYEYDNQKAALSGDYYGSDRISGGIVISSDQIQSAGLAIGGTLGAIFDFGIYYITSSWIKLKEDKITSYESGAPLVTTINYYYDNPVHAQLTRTETSTSTDTTIETKTVYPDDILNAAALTVGGQLTSTDYTVINKLKIADKYRIATPIQIETYEKEPGGTTTLLSVQRNLFKEEHNLILPGIIQGAKATDNVDNRVEYHKYDANGNPLEVSLSGGTKISYIWGYDKTLPIAKIEHASYAEIATALQIAESQLLTYNETHLGAINGLRTSLPQAMITTYTYKPLIGIESATDPKGYIMHYEYDSFNRLKLVKDADGHLLKSYEYNYKQ